MTISRTRLNVNAKFRQSLSLRSDNDPICSDLNLLKVRWREETNDGASFCRPRIPIRRKDVTRCGIRVLLKF